MSEPIGIEIKNLFKIFGARGRDFIDAINRGMTKQELNDQHRHVLGLRDINISIPAGEIQVVMGLSGSGKSTLIRHINRLIDPTAGEILIEGTDVVKMSPETLRAFRMRKTAMVFQKFGLLPHRTVIENVGYGLEIQGVDAAARNKTAMRWIERVGLLGFETKYPAQLSGGMQQRVGLARALANDAPILLMDEAYSALDPLIRYDMQTVLLDLQREVRKTIVFITHDLDEALRIGDRIALLRDGSVIQQGTGQDIVLNPADDYVANFVQHVDRGKVLRVGSVMEPLNGASLPEAVVRSDLSLAEALRDMMTRGIQNLGVHDPNGTPVGQLSMQRAIAVSAGA
ncbi:quaternary amine ABC transporter ATP-binding protein [Paracoccus laeviglucosivorans]|uniref:Quaternary amine transport ATP-binding protein n=1 Tax=Paracoccus laeviglucosivorans TaxID=1197861 RepID=A0A521F9B1_9RHOB|nr:glycine betaine/L-proline ABC transporter ATP-binding protein [Paracoccus laeviglucosivorans]SMO92748.1 glycine betaine/proline transport system ATP-binding protein [Paracoccus laeviglucosivorans]